MTGDVGAAIAVVSLIPAIFGLNLPPLATVRAEADYDGSQAAGLRAAVVTGVIVVGVAGALTRSRTVLVVGSVALVAQAAIYGHAIPRG